MVYRKIPLVCKDRRRVGARDCTNAVVFFSIDAVSAIHLAATSRALSWAPSAQTQRSDSPFQGTLRVVDVESAMAYSSDGRHWQVRRRNRLGHFRTVGVWSERARDVIGRCRDAEVLNAALRSRPPLPFPQYNPSPNDSPCLAAVTARISDFERYYECIAHPFEW